MWAMRHALLGFFLSPQRISSIFLLFAIRTLLKSFVSSFLNGLKSAVEGLPPLLMFSHLMEIPCKAPSSQKRYIRNLGSTRLNMIITDIPKV